MNNIANLFLKYRSALASIGMLMCCWFALQAPLLSGIRALPGDTMYEFYPMAYFNVHSVRKGYAP